MGRDALWELGRKPSACLEVSDSFTELALGAGVVSSKEHRAQGSILEREKY